MSPTWRERWAGHDLRWSIVLVLAVALAASVSGLGNLFAYDDIPIVVENPMVTQLHTPLEYLTDSYWGPSRGNSLYRPFTIIAFGLEWAVGRGSPFPFHLANVVLYALSAVAALLLLRRLLPRGPALVAALAWAAHPVHVEAVANVVGQSEMWAALPMLLALTAYVRDRQAGPLTRRTVALIVACQAWALLHKEHGIVPKTILKPVRDSLEALYEMDYVELAPAAESSGKKKGKKVAESDPALTWSADRLRGELAKLRDEMLHAAEELRFEDAAKLRDRVKQLEQLELSR